MKFRVERDAFVDALAVVGPAIASRGGALPVLAGVRIEADADYGIQLTASDLDLTVSTRIDAHVALPGAAVVPGKILSDIVRSVEAGAVNLTHGEVTNEVDVAAGRFKSTIRGLPVEEWPRGDDLSGQPGATVTYENLVTALTQVLPAASNDDARPILTGVLFERLDNQLRIVATDSYRLALRDLADTSIGYDEGSVLVPSRALKTLVKAKASEKITVHLSERAASFHFGETTITTRLIEGEFPNYKGLLPKLHTCYSTTSREMLSDALRRVALMAREATPVRLTFTAASVDLDAVTQDIGQAAESIDATSDYDGELPVGFNPHYLADGLDQIPGDEVHIRLTDANKPVTLTSTEDGSYLYLLMPVRI